MTAGSLPAALADRLHAPPGHVWTPADFADLGSRAAIDKALQRMVHAGTLRRIDRGLYDRPGTNALTGRPTVPDYRQVIAAVARRDQVRVLIDGMTAANDLGLTTAVPAQVEVLVDARLRPITLGTQTIRFRTAAPSRLYWAGRPAMRVVQTLHWVRDTLADPTTRTSVMTRLRAVLADPTHGAAIRDDLRDGLPAMPIWMQHLARELLVSASASSSAPRTPRTASRTASHP